MNQPHKQVLDEAPPFLKTWPRVYRFVLAYLVCVIALIWLFTRFYAPAA
jgi:hypothetical protein